MIKFDSASAGRTMVIGNHSNGCYMFNSWIANLEVFDTVEMCDEFIQAHMKHLDTTVLTGDIVYSIRVANSYYENAMMYIKQVADRADGPWSQRRISTLTAILLRNIGIDSAGPPGPHGMTARRAQSGWSQRRARRAGGSWSQRRARRAESS